MMPGSEGKLRKVMESNSDFGNDEVGDDVALSLCVYFHCVPTIHRKLFKRLILIIKDLHHLAYPIDLILFHLSLPTMFLALVEIKNTA